MGCEATRSSETVRWEGGGVGLFSSSDGEGDDIVGLMF